MHDTVQAEGTAPAQPVIAPVAPYISPDYARAESDKLWAQVWQIACRAEELPKVGDYVTYDIMDESIIVVRTAPAQISAYYNVCQHRGRRLTTGCGHTNQFYCRFHGWRWDLEGENIFVLDREDWGEALACENLRLKEVKVDIWGGWVWINMDPDCEPLLDYLAPLVTRLGPFELDKMRYRWRQWLVFPSNWKAAIGAFIESYHLYASHPQLLRNPTGRRFWTQLGGRHSFHGDAGPRGGDEQRSGGLSAPRGREGVDPRVAVADDLEMMWETLNATTTETFVKASKRLVEELPEGVTMAEVGAHLLHAAKADDAARGVIWPELTQEQMIAGSAIWHVFPNSVMIVGLTTALCYRVRPNGNDPDSCIFEVYVIERFPEGQEPKTEWVYEPDPSEERWRLILAQDFQNMPEVQKGMKSRGFPGIRPNPSQELSVVHFLQNLADYMGTGAPQPIGR
jgi:phenylpropionate dioxygenase-like ring-hydroxylating dioxygenase large terminal subunit